VKTWPAQFCAGELRAALRGMSLTERAAVLLGERVVAEFVDAALEAPALLSGVDSQMYEKFANRVYRPCFPEGPFKSRR
jgi:hypothetical protein